MTPRLRTAISALCTLVVAAGACTSGSLSQRAEPNTARVCPEPVYTDPRGTPRSVASRQVRECFPGDPASECLCDSDGDCYALNGYVACVSPEVDGGVVVDTGAPEDVATVDAAGVDAAAVDVLDAARESATPGVCPEAVYRDGSGTPRSVSTRQIRWCFPGESACLCDRDGDCYSLTGYVACTPPAAPTPDASVDAAPDAAPDVAPDVARVDAAPDVAPDSGPGVCPEAVYLDSRSTPRSVTTRQIRWCFPGEARCFCDSDNDCYSLTGYVACTPPAAPAPDASAPDASAPDATMDVAAPDVSMDVAAPDATSTDAAAPSPLPADPVVYTGALSGANGLSMSRLTVAGEARDVWVYAPATRGAMPPLVLAFHGTNATGDVMINDSGARAVADANGVVVVAPSSRWFSESGADYDHPGGNGTYWDTTDTNPDTNADLRLVRAAIVEAQRRYNTDPDRVYVIGHSNGGFMSLLVSVALHSRVAAFAENAAGLVTCASRPLCRFTGSSLSCAGLAAEAGWCGCSGAGFPVAPTAGRAVPGYLSHGNTDSMVSVQYTCALAARLAAAGVEHRTVIWSGDHFLSSNFARNAWPFLAQFRRR